jgi:hypothetical protein
LQSLHTATFDLIQSLMNIAIVHIINRFLNNLVKSRIQLRHTRLYHTICKLYVTDVTGNACNW